MRILHISDTHVGGKKYFNRDAFVHVIKKADSGDFDVLIHTGDLTQAGRPEYYEEAQKLLDKIEIPYVVIPGNHDKRSGGYSLFKEYIGSVNGTLSLDGSVVIYVDSGVSDSNIGRVGMNKFDMIKEALKKNRKKPIKIVVLHHHTIPVPKAGRERNVLSNAGDLLELFLKTDVDLVLAGHRHHPNVHQVEDTVFVNAGTVSGRKTRHGDVNSYNVIDINEEEISVNTIRMNNSEVKKTFPRRRRKIFHDFGERKLRIAQMANSFVSSLTESPMPNTIKFLHNHFSNAIDTINESDVDLVVHCGGIVEEGISRNYKLANQYLSKIDPPIFYSPAGRDINYLGYHLFQENFGDFDQVFANDEFYLRGVSSAQYDSPIGFVGETEREEVFENIRERDESFKGIFLHHNIVPIPHAREKGLLEDSGDILRNSIDEEIDLILTGTSSHPFATKVGNTVVANANAISSVYQRCIYGNSFNFIDIYENAIVVSDINSLWGNRRLLGMWRRTD